MSERINIRTARPDDAETLVDFNLEMALVTEDIQLDREILAKGVSAVFEDDTRGFYVVAEDAGNGKIVGGLLVGREWSDWRNSWYWWIASVFVDENYRKSGIYRRMYDFVKENARSRGNVHGFRLYVELENESAQKVYEKVGMLSSNYLMFEEILDEDQT